MATVTLKPIRGKGPTTWNNIPNAYDGSANTYANVSISPANAVNRYCDFYFDLSAIGLGSTVSKATLTVSLGYGGSDNMCTATFEISTTKKVLYTTSLINQSSPGVTFTTNFDPSLVKNLQGIRIRPHVDEKEGTDRQWGFLIYDVTLTVEYYNSGSKAPYLGTTKINNICLGTSQIQKVYLGTTEVFSSGNACTSLSLNPTSSSISTTTGYNTALVHVTIGPSNCTEALTYTKSGSSATIAYSTPFDTGHSYSITGVSSGTTTITFKCGSKTAKYTVTVY